jgi:hypothetical protein
MLVGVVLEGAKVVLEHILEQEVVEVLVVLGFLQEILIRVPTVVRLMYQVYLMVSLLLGVGEKVGITIMRETMLPVVEVEVVEERMIMMERRVVAPLTVLGVVVVVEM